MPVITINPVAVLNPDVPFERMAFRCSLNVVATEAGVESGTCAIHATKYRKLDGGGLDVLGLQGSNEQATSVTFGQNATDDALIADMTAVVVGYAEQTGAISFNFSWRVEAGDIVGMVQLNIGDDYTKGVGNTTELENSDPAFALAFSEVITTISAWCQAKGW